MNPEYRDDYISKDDPGDHEQDGGDNDRDGGGGGDQD